MTPTDDGKEMSVGHFAMPPGLAATTEQRQRPYVFICCTARDGSLAYFARPSYWLLTQSLGVEAFLDEASVQVGASKDDAFAGPLYECTHALLILSPSFQSRKFCKATHLLQTDASWTIE